jgi:ribosome-associated protein
MDSEEQEEKSRSQIKREFRELKELVKELIELPDWHLDRIPLTERNRAEIVTARDLSRSALQRQLRYLVRRIEGSEDISAIRSAVDDPPAIPDDDEAPSEVEEQAAELIAGDNDLLGRFIDDHPELDHRKLRRLLRAARKERKRGPEAPRTAAQELVEYLISQGMSQADP